MVPIDGDVSSTRPTLAPVFLPEAIDQWEMLLHVFLMKDKSNHLGLKKKIFRKKKKPTDTGYDAAEELELDKEKKIYISQCDSAYSAMSEGLRQNDSAKSVADLYAIEQIRNGKPLRAWELLELLKKRFHSSLGNRREKALNCFTNFKMEPCDKLNPMNALLRLSRYRYDLQQYGETVSDTALLVKMKQAFRIKGFEGLVTQLSSLPDGSTFAEAVDNCATWFQCFEEHPTWLDPESISGHDGGGSDATDGSSSNSSVNNGTDEINHVYDEGVKFCHFCKTRGHLKQNCRKRIADQKRFAKLNYKAKSRNENASSKSSKQTETCAFCKKQGHKLKECDFLLRKLAEETDGSDANSETEDSD